MGLGEVPLEVLFHIFSFLSSVRDLCRCSRVCRKWQEALAEESPVWKHVMENSALRHFLRSPLIENLTGSKAKLVAFDNAWNRHDCSRNISLLDNGLTLHRDPVAQSTDAIRGKCGYLRGQHYWTVTWHKPAFGSNAVIGVATQGEEMHRAGYCALLGSSYESWGWDISSGFVKHGGREVDKYPKNWMDKQIRIGQTIGVTLDMDKKTLSFDVEGCFLGVAFTNLPPRSLYPAVSAVFGNSEISLVYYGAPLVG